MLYLKTNHQDGTSTFTPITNNNIYLHCNKCGKLVPVYDLMDFVAELGEADMESGIFDICEECFEKQCKREEEYVKKHYPPEK